MKRSSRSPPRSTKRVIVDGLVEQPANPLKYASTFSESRVRGTIDAHIPLSLDAGAGRRHWYEVLRLLVTGAVALQSNEKAFRPKTDHGEKRQAAGANSQAVVVGA